MGAKGGRPRKTGERHPGGQLKKYVAEKTISPALWGRLKVADSTLGTPIGWLVYEGHLSRAQADTGLRIGEIYRTWHRHQRLRTAAKSANLEQGFSGGADVAEERLDADELERLELQVQRAEENFRDLEGVIAECPANLRSAVLDLCVYETTINPAMYPDIRTFLTRMGHFFNQGGQRRRGKGQETAIFEQKIVQHTHSPPGVTHIRRGDSPRVATEAVIRRLLPKLTDKQVADIMEIWSALRDRAEMRAKKARRLP